MNLVSPITIWKQGNRFNIKIEALNIVLSVSQTTQPATFEKVRKAVEEGEFTIITPNEEQD